MDLCFQILCLFIQIKLFAMLRLPQHLVATYFRLVSMSFWHHPLIFENVFAFWYMKIFQTHLIYFCKTHGNRLFPNDSSFLSVGKKLYE